jgi:hypothetical protein
MKDGFEKDFILTTLKKNYEQTFLYPSNTKKYNV